MYSRSELPPRDRQLVTLGVLTALGGCEIELEVHVNAALNVGLSPSEISEALLHSAVYCGVPRSINATLVAKKVFAERGLLPITNVGPFHHASTASASSSSEGRSDVGKASAPIAS
jgi:4-carboxymuconolactone decarboxylase